MENDINTGWVLALSKRADHHISKINCTELQAITGLGIEGDAHLGKTVKHRSRVAVDPSQPNLRQVHLIHAELFDELKAQGFDILPGLMGENITTKGLDLLKLPRHTKLHIGTQTILEVTGLRNPCLQLNSLQKGLLKAVAFKNSNGILIRKAGIMAIVKKGGKIKCNDTIQVELPSPPFLPLERV